MDKVNQRNGLNKSISKEAINVLMDYDYPGNIRELENIIEHAFVLCHGNEIKREHLPKEILDETLSEYKKDYVMPGKEKFSEAEREIILSTLRRHNGNRTDTARELGLNKTTLWRKMKKLNISYEKQQS